MNQKSSRISFDHVPSECFAVRTAIVSHLILNIYNKELKPHGLKITQMFVLVLSARGRSVRVQDIRKTLMIDNSTMSRTLERMKASGWIELESSGWGRAQSIKVTRTGFKMINKAMPAWERAQSRVKETLGKQGSKALMDLYKSASPSGAKGLLYAKSIANPESASLE